MNNQFLAVATRRDWLRHYLSNVAVEGDDVSLLHRDRYDFRTSILLEQFAQIDFAQTLAVDHLGHLFILDRQARIWVFEAASGYTEPVFGSGHGLFTITAMLATLDGKLIVADAYGSAPIRAYLPGTAQTVWELTLPVTPLAISANQGFLYVFGRLESALGSRTTLLKVSKNGQVVGRRALELESGHMDFDQKPILASSDEQVFLWNETLQHLLVYNAELELQRIVTQAELGCRGQIVDIVANRPGHVILVTRSASEPGFQEQLLQDQPLQDPMVQGQTMSVGEPFQMESWEWEVSGSLTPLPYRKLFDKLLADKNGQLYAFWQAGQRIDILEQRSQISIDEKTGLPHGYVYTLGFDSGTAGTEWHRIVLEADIPDECDLRIQYYASDRETLITTKGLESVDDLVLNREESESTLQQLFDSTSTPAMMHTTDALLQGAFGRFLWLQIHFVGTNDKTPILRQLRVFYPRDSMLSFLPAIYQEDETSKSFLVRYLSMFDSILGSVNQNIEDVSRLFDVDAAPAEFRRWVGTWLGYDFDDTWTDSQVKQMLKSYPSLKRLRGTRQSIEMIVEIRTGKKPLIVEYFEYASVQQQPELKELMNRLYGDNPYSFCVLVDAGTVPDDRHQYTLIKLLEQYKPAFTEAKLILLNPWTYMDMHSYLGINTVLSEPTELRLEQNSILPHDTVIIDVNTENRLGLHSRVEFDSQIE